MGQMLWDAYGAPPQSAPHDLTDCDRAGITHQRPFVGPFTKLTFPRAPGRQAAPNNARVAIEGLCSKCYQTDKFAVPFIYPTRQEDQSCRSSKVYRRCKDGTVAIRSAH
jgi:hypothetical protein